jgi:hypothetical protein
MTLDQLDKKIIEIKKKGLHKVVELEQIRKVRGEYFQEKSEKTFQTISQRFMKNIVFLSIKFKSFPSSGNIKEFMGVTPSNSYDAFIKSNSEYFSIKDAILVSEYYGVPVNLLLFDDIELYGEQIWKEYRSLFQ